MDQQKLAAKQTEKLITIKQDVIQNPHDAFFKSMCENINVTIDLLKTSLSNELFAKIKLSTLKLTDKSFVTPKLRQHHSDIIYEAEINGHMGYISFLIEHQSTDDRLMAFRKLEYNVSLMRQHLKQGNEKLPVIINICLYHGEKSPYPHSTDLLDCFSDPILAKEWMFKPFQLIDLTVMSDQEIENHGYAALMEFLFKHYRDAELSRKAKKLVLFLKRLDADLHLENVLYYLSEVCGNEDDARLLLDALVTELPEKKEVIMTYGQQLKQEGAQNLRFEIARGMIQEGLDDHLIQKLTRLSSDMLVKMKKDLSQG